jgi:diaminobutyrate-2-oxoglutarate transaminase
MVSNCCKVYLIITPMHLPTDLAEPARPAAAPASALLARQARRESNARSYPRRLPVALVAGRGVTVRDADGREYLDCLAGAGSLALGHHHPVVVEAIQRALHDEVPFTTLDLATPVRDRFVESLFAVLPASLADGRILFCGPTGADAIEAALKLVKTATGRRGAIAFGGAYHGMTHGALALTGARAPKEPIGGLVPGVQFLPFPSDHRPPFGVGGDEGARQCARLLGWALDDDHSGVPLPAGVFLEPVQGEGGVNPAPPTFAQLVRASTAAAGVPLVVDEVQTGLGRTGTLWGCEALGIEPDVLVLSKAIGGGLPLAVVVHRGELDRWEPGAHAGTFRGNQLAMAAGAATIDHVVAEGLADHAAHVGAVLVEGLLAHAHGDPRVGDVRGRGLMVGVELVDPERLDGVGVPVPDGDLAAAVQAGMLEAGVIVERGGRHGAVVRFLPPLVISEAEVLRVADAFGRALAGTRARA